MRAFAILLLAGAQLVEGQSTSHARKKAKPASAASQAPEDWPVSSVTVTGNHTFPSDAIIKVAGIHVGDKVSKESFEAARQRLVDAGVFQSVGYQYKATGGNKPGYAATFEVEEIKPLYKVEFAALPGGREKIEAYLKAHDALYVGLAPPTQEVLNRWSQFLDAYTAQENHPQKVIGRLISTGPDQYVARFQPDAPLPVVARVEFTDNDAIDETTLQNTIGSVAYGLPFTEENFRELLENQLRPLYEAQGLLKVHFEDIKTETVPLPTKGLAVHVKVIEGPVYKFGQIRVSGVDADQRDGLLHVAALKTGETANFDLVSQGVEKVKNAVRRQGYYNVKAESERTLDETAKKVQVVIKVDPGSLYKFRTLTIKGLDLNGEAAIRKLWGEKPGSPFNADYPEHFLKTVKEDQIFDYLGATKSETKVDDATHAADVTLIFGAAPPPDPEKKRGQKRTF